MTSSPSPVTPPSSPSSCHSCRLLDPCAAAKSFLKHAPPPPSSSLLPPPCHRLCRASAAVRRRHRLQFSTETRRPFGGKRAGGLGRPGTGGTGVGVGMRDSNEVAGALLRLHCSAAGQSPAPGHTRCANVHCTAAVPWRGQPSGRRQAAAFCNQSMLLCPAAWQRLRPGDARVHDSVRLTRQRATEAWSSWQRVQAGRHIAATARTRGRGSLRENQGEEGRREQSAKASGVNRTAELEGAASGSARERWFVLLPPKPYNTEL